MITATRRGFLRVAGGSAAFASLANLRALPAAASGTGGRFFAPAEREVLTQVVERMVETGEPAAPAVRATGAIDAIDALCLSLDPDATAPLPPLLRLVEWSPLVFDGRFSRFTTLADDEQDRALTGWMRSRFAWRRMAFLALRNLALLGYWSQDATWPLIGYRGPLLARDRAGGTPGPTRAGAGL